MKYEYKCNNCKIEKVFKFDMGKNPKEIKCEDCKKGIMKQDFVKKMKGMFINTPESFKSGSEYAPKDYRTDKNSQLEDYMDSID